MHAGWLAGWLDDGIARWMNKWKRRFWVLAQFNTSLQEPRLLWTLDFGSLATPLREPFPNSPATGFLPFTSSP